MDNRNLTLGVDGAGLYRLEALGQTWVFSPLTERDKGEFEAWIRQSLIGSVREMRTALEPTEYREMMAAVVGDLGSGHYKFGAPGCVKWLSTEAGVRLLLRLSLGYRHGQLTDDQVYGLMEADSEGLGAALKEVVAEASGDPNRKRRATAKTTPTTA